MTDGAARTDTHNDTVAESFQMTAPILRRLQHVVQHLNRFGMLDLGMTFDAQSLRQVLMNLFPHQSPGWGIIHQKYVVAFANHVAHFVPRAVTRNGASLLQQLLDDATVRQNDRCAGAQLKAVHAPILLCPFGESV